MRRTLPWLLLAGCAAALAPAASGDSALFEAAGSALFSGHWRDAFGNSSLQAGPFQLALYGSLGAHVGFVVAPVLALLLVGAARACGVRDSQVLGLAGLVAILTGLTSSGIDSGHPADALLPLLWIVAAAQARRGRTLAAASIVGLSAGFETWGILGIAVLALAPRLRSAVWGAAAAAGIAATLYLPFVLSGNFAMGGYQWRVSNQSLISYVVAPGTPVGWPLRIAQGALALAAGLAVARFRRGSAHALWIVPCVVVLVRLLLDPLDSGYYMVGVTGPAIVGLALVSVWGARLPRFAREQPA